MTPEKTIAELEQFILWIRNGHRIALDNDDDFWVELWQMAEDAITLIKRLGEQHGKGNSECENIKYDNFNG